MKKYRVVFYPVQESYTTVVEAESVEKAIEIAQEECDINCSFVALEKDVKEIK